MMRLSEDEVIRRGLLAEAFLNSDDFNDLYEAIQRDISLEILATALDDKEFRESLYITFNGMRALAQRMTAYANAMRAIEEKRNADNTDEQEIDY